MSKSKRANYIDQHRHQSERIKHISTNRLPAETSLNEIEYYTATNIKIQTAIQQVYVQSGSPIRTNPPVVEPDRESCNIRDYVLGLEYLNEEQEGYYHEEGRINLKEGGRLEYTLKDHLGNGRVYCYYDAALSQPKTIQEAHYYAFGLPIQKLSPNFEAAVGVEGNNYQYNGKELNEDFGLHWMDYGARWYDPQINGWGQIDPLAEKYVNISPYAYVANNPMVFVDPNGKEIINAHGDFSIHVDFVNSLRNNIDRAKASGNKQDIKNAKKEYRKAEREGIVEGVDKYTKVNELMTAFKDAVGEEEYNYFNNLTFEGETIDINITVTSDMPDGKDGKTSFRYIPGISVDYVTKEESIIPVGIEKNAINVYLKKTNLETIANEMGDVQFGVERANTSYSERDRPYWGQKTTQFSFDYQNYVIKKRHEKPNPKNY